MMKQILGQSYYQSVAILIFGAFGLQILGFFHTDDSPLTEASLRYCAEHDFNMFVFPQIFNSFNRCRLDRKSNVFEGIWRNWY
ncbi:hypothetical protein EDB83DRAFT_2404828 [Lactarius deliciosus]|nr:hypothetical protein EDB83DRAFT_2404828 [Lactarius deliciosus]